MYIHFRGTSYAARQVPKGIMIRRDSKDVFTHTTPHTHTHTVFVEVSFY
jgi:hypothetical protein